MFRARRAFRIFCPRRCNDKMRTCEEEEEVHSNASPRARLWFLDDKSYSSLLQSQMPPSGHTSRLLFQTLSLLFSSLSPRMALLKQSYLQFLTFKRRIKNESHILGYLFFHYCHAKAQSLWPWNPRLSVIRLLLCPSPPITVLLYFH